MSSSTGLSSSTPPRREEPCSERAQSPTTQEWGCQQLEHASRRTWSTHVSTGSPLTEAQRLSLQWEKNWSRKDLNGPSTVRPTARVEEHTRQSFRRHSAAMVTTPETSFLTTPPRCPTRRTSWPWEHWRWPSTFPATVGSCPTWTSTNQLGSRAWARSLGPQLLSRT